VTNDSSRRGSIQIQHVNLVDQELRQSIVNSMARLPSQELPNEKEIDALMNQLSNEGLLLGLQPEQNHAKT
jgi:Tfp pilus assembly protein PilO